MDTDTAATTYTTEDGAELATTDDLRAELSARGLAVSGNKTAMVERLLADDAGEATDTEPDDGAEPDAEPSVADEWATFMRPDGSKYLVYIGAGEVPVNQEGAEMHRTAPEDTGSAPPHVQMFGTDTP